MDRWKLAAVIAAAIALLLWLGKGSIPAGFEKLGLPRIGDFTKLNRPNMPDDEASDYSRYNQDATGGILPACNGCGPGYRLQFFGSPRDQASWFALNG